MTKKKKDYSKAILERIVGTKSKTYLADEFRKAFAEKYGIKREELKGLFYYYDKLIFKIIQMGLLINKTFKKSQV